MTKLYLRLAILDCKLNAIIDLLANDNDKQRIQNEINEVYKNISELHKGKKTVDVRAKDGSFESTYTINE